MARLKLPEGDKHPLDRLYQLSPGLGEAALKFRTAVYANHGLPERIFEACRMRVAQINGCPICLATRRTEGAKAGVTEDFYTALSEYRTSPLFNARERLAIEYTEKFMLEHHSLDDEFFTRARALFTDEELMSLTIVIARHMAFGRLTTVMDMVTDCPIDGTALGRGYSPNNAPHPQY
jgi:AhpD family alkylhydroperoxidase